MTRTEAPEDAASAAAMRRTAYLVLGMHRSGTSAMTQLLALAGADLPRNVMPADEHNAQGYFEPWRIAIFNDERLRAAGSAWDDVFVFPRPGLAPAEDEKAWRTRAMGLMREEFGDAPHPLMKDPRTTVMLPFWREVLEAEGLAARCIIPVRHPLAVAGSLARRDNFAPEKSVLLWSAYMLAAEAFSRDLPRVFVDYDRLLADWRGEVTRIERAHGAPLPALDARAEREIDAALTGELRHNTPKGELAALGWTGEIAAQVHGWFAAAAHDEAPGPAPLEAATQALAARQRDIGPLVSPAARDFDATRAELHGLRQTLAWERRELDLQKSVIDQAGQALEAILSH